MTEMNDETIMTQLDAAYQLGRAHGFKDGVAYGYDAGYVQCEHDNMILDNEVA